MHYSMLLNNIILSILNKCNGTSWYQLHYVLDDYMLSYAKLLKYRSKCHLFIPFEVENRTF